MVVVLPPPNATTKKQIIKTFVMTTKICLDCQQEKDIQLFYNATKKKDGKRSICKECDKARRKQNTSCATLEEKDIRKQKNQEWCKKNHNHRSRYWLKKKYNLSDDEIDTLQNIKNCPLCGREVIYHYQGRGKRNRVVVDHDHKTNRVRGFICSPCNQIIGILKDDIPTFKNIVAYLERNQTGM